MGMDDEILIGRDHKTATNYGCGTDVHSLAAGIPPIFVG